ncbi:MAG: GldG family protein [Acidobacteriota bacterium]|nr:GldG family protein [Acidobacteriota bacterium]
MAHLRRRLRIALSALPVLAVLVGAYFLSQQFYLRHDLTRGRLFSLNQGTLDLLAELEEDIHIRLYFSEDLPPRFKPVADFVRTLVSEYEQHGRGKVIVSVTDPGDDRALVEEAYRLGLSETRANIIDKNRQVAVEIWFGIAITRGEDGLEAFPSVQSIADFEYDISSAILRLTRRGKSRVAMVGPTFAEGGGVVFDIRRDMKPVYRKLSQMYDVRQIRLEPDTRPDLTEADALMVWGLPWFTPDQLYAVDQYIVSGKPALLLVSGLKVSPNVLLAQALPASNADDFYRHLGFRVNRTLVSDMQCTKIKFNKVRPPVFKDYPLFPKLTRTGGGLDGTFSGTMHLESMVLPWASDLEPVRREDVDHRIIARTSDQAWVQDEGYLIDPDKAPGPTSFDRYTLALALTGRFSSFFETPPEGMDPTQHRARSETPSTVMIWGSEHVITQAAQKSTLEWAEHAAGFMTHRTQLGDIDRRDNAFSPIREVPDAEKETIRRLSVTVAPVLILAAAFIRHVLRRRRDLKPWLQEDTP